MSHTKTQLQNNDKEFDEKFPRMFAGTAGQYNENGDVRPYYNDDVKIFLHSSSTKIIEAYTKDIIEMIEGMKLSLEKICNTEKHVLIYGARNQALTDIISSLKKTIKE